MIRIGLLSDTYGHLDEKIVEHVKECQEIWHAGDIGDLKVAKRLSQLPRITPGAHTNKVYHQ